MMESYVRKTHRPPGADKDVKFEHPETMIFTQNGWVNSVSAKTFGLRPIEAKLERDANAAGFGKQRALARY